MNTDWKVASNQIKFKESITQNKNGIEKKVTFNEFFKNPEYQKGLSDWTNERTQWAEEQNKLKQQKRYKYTEMLFRKFWGLYQNLKKESIEMMIGQGILIYQQIEYPILLKKVVIDFDATNNVISVIDTNTAPELNTALLETLENVDKNAIDIAVKELEANPYHPLDTNAQKFLENFTHSLNPSAKYYDISELSTHPYRK